MPNAIDNAITRMQNIAQALSTLTDVSGGSVTIKSALDYPVENVEPFPCAICYVGGGQFMLTNASIHHNFPSLNVEFHFSRVNLRQAYLQIGQTVLEFPKRLAGDPTLDGSIDTILAGRDTPVTYTVRPYQWTPQGVTPIIMSQMLLFTIPIKTLQAPVSTST